jgi:ssDNA-binding Zn-finger/Zn-ribbon topoisomerase 1
MSLKVPESMEECVYFTNRYIGEKGHVLAWVYRKECPKCHKARMGKPVVKGKVKTRADYYECPECKYQESKQEHEESLILEAQYTCPECGKDGEGTTKYIRKKYKGVLSFIIICQHCGAEIPITKKLKEPKKK